MAEGKGDRGEVAMLLGKRPRSFVRRTTSMTFSAEDLAAGEGTIHRHDDFHRRERQRAATLEEPPRSIQRRSFNDLAAIETTAEFLMACCLCNRRLGPGLDTFMYRGEISFCSLECRQHGMKQDELQNKISKKTDATSSTTASETSGNGQTVIAA